MKIWREPEGALPNGLAIGYAVLGQVGGWVLLVQPHPLPFLLGIVLTAHALIIAAYLVHECAHATLFAARDLNRRVGELMLWLTGSAYASFARVQHLHIRHHADRADVSLFDYRAFLQHKSAWVRRLVLALEWAYVPAVELIMHGQVMLRPFFEPKLAGYRKRVLVVLATRLVLFAVLGYFSMWALLGFAVAYLAFLKGLFLADAFAHTYPEYFVNDPDQPVPKDDRDKAYDVEHTFSNLLSTSWRWANLWNLNFGYHTAHHERASVPWYRLPRTHAEVFGDSHVQVLPFTELWRCVHRHRTKRVFGVDYGDVGSGPGRADGFAGVLGVNFLTIV